MNEPAVPASLPSGQPSPAPSPPRWPFLVAGAVSVAVAIAVGEIVAGLVAGAPSLVVAIGSLVIDLQPAGAKDLVVSLFGTNDKLALNVVVLVAALAIGGFLGLVARTRFGRVAAGTSPSGSWRSSPVRLEAFSAPLSVVTVVLAVGAALLTLRVLVDAAEQRIASVRRPGRGCPTGTAAGSSSLSGSLAVGSIAVGSIGRALSNAHAPEPVSVNLPPPSLASAPPPAGCSRCRSTGSPRSSSRTTLSTGSTRRSSSRGSRRHLERDRERDGRPDGDR